MDIASATFNSFANGYLGFFFDPDNNPGGARRPTDPVASWTAHSVTVDYGSDWPAQLVADQPTLRFDVQTAAVPESSALAFAGARRR